MLFSLSFLLAICVIFRCCKEQLDIQQDAKSIEVWTKWPPKDQRLARMPHGLILSYQTQHLANSYYPLLILLPLNILTGTSKAFGLTLFFPIVTSTALPISPNSTERSQIIDISTPSVRIYGCCCPFTTARTNRRAQASPCLTSLSHDRHTK